MKFNLLLLIFLFTLTAQSQPGEIDTTFGVNGKTTTGFGANSNMATRIAFQTDGKFIVAGTCVSSHGENDFALSRYNSNGSLDTTFGAGGKVTTDFLELNNNYNCILTVSILADGKIMAFGSTGMVTFYPKSAIVRYNTDGTIDTSFGSNGKVISELAPFDQYGDKMIFQPDGRFVIAGLKFYTADARAYTGVERYSQDGIIDTTFGTDGQAVTSFGPGRSSPSTMALQPDGKIVIAGNYVQPNNGPQLTVIRYNPNGTLDTGFDGDGKLTTTFGAGSVGQAMHVSVNTGAKILVAGLVTNVSSRNLSLVQYNSNGSPDTSFDGDGKVLTPFDLADNYSLINSITKQPDGNFIVVAGFANSGFPTSKFVVRRYNSNGTIDTGFGTNGTATATFNTGLDEAESAAINANGELFVVGRSTPVANDHIDFAIAKYDGNGSLDTTLDGDGKLTTAFEKSNDKLKTLLILPNDKLIGVGTSGYRSANNSTVTDIALSKYNSDGSPDTSFGTSGKVVSPFGTQINSAMTAALQADGKIIVSNMYYLFASSTYSYEIIRYNTDGSLDSLFGTNGKIALSFNATSIACQPDGKIIVAGDEVTESVNDIIINRYNSNGTLDTGFGGDGNIALTFGNYHYATATIVLQPDGKLIVTDTTSFLDLYNGSTVFATARINSDGNLDSSFGTDGKVTTLIGNGGFAYASFIQPDGKIVIAGRAFDGNVNFSSVRYLPNGTIDTAYGTNGIASSNLWSDYKEIKSVLLQADGKLLAVLSKYNEVPDTYDFKIRRFNPDGTYDDSFGGTYGVSTSFYNGYDEAFSIGLQSDDKILVAGTTHGINQDFALARYDNQILGVRDFDAGSSDVVVYPNPVKDLLYVKSENNELDIIDYKISNMLGQLVYKGSDTNIAIDSGNFSSGIYTILLRTNKGITTKKFIKE